MQSSEATLSVRLVAPPRFVRVNGLLDLPTLDVGQDLDDDRHDDAGPI